MYYNLIKHDKIKNLRKDLDKIELKIKENSNNFSLFDKKHAKDIQHVISTTSTNDEIDSNVEEFMSSIYSGTWMINNNQIVFEGYNETNDKSMSVNWYYNLNNDILILSNIEEYEHGVTDGTYWTFQRK